MRRKKIVPCLFLTVALCGCTTQTVEDAKQIEESKTYVSKYEYETDTDGKTETQAYSEEKPLEPPQFYFHRNDIIVHEWHEIPVCHYPSSN